MRRSNEEFKAEVYRRRDELLKQRKKRTIRNFAAMVACFPLFCMAAVLAISLSISLQGAGSAAPDANMNNIAYMEVENSEITSELDHEANFSKDTIEEVMALFAEVTASEAFKPTEEEFFSQNEPYYTVTLRDTNGIYAYFCVYEKYILWNGEYFALTKAQYAEFASVFEK